MVILTFDRLIPKCNHHIYEPKFICEQKLGKIPFIGFWGMVFTRFLGHCLLWPWPLTSKSKQHTYEPKHICNQNWVKFPSLLFEMWCLQGFWDTQTNRLTHGRTHPKNRMPPASKFFSGGGTEKHLQIILPSLSSMSSSFSCGDSRSSEGPLTLSSFIFSNPYSDG